MKPKAGGGYTVCASDLEAKAAELTSGELFQSIKKSIKTRPFDEVDQILPGRAANPENVKRVERLFSESDWDHLFPLRNVGYSYTNLLRSVGLFEAICGTYTDGRDSDAICRKSLATMFAHFVQETGYNHGSYFVDGKQMPTWQQGLYHLREINKGDYRACGDWTGEAFPCAPGVQYYGRGAKQLSWNYNYGLFGKAIFGDTSVLLNDPERVADTWLNLATATFFFVTPQSPKPSMLHVIDGTWQPNDQDLALGFTAGFGATTNIINGGLECGSGGESNGSRNRIAYYKIMADYMQVPIAADEQLGCATQSNGFSQEGAGSQNLHWDQDWSGSGENFACHLVKWQNGHNALYPGSYQSCIEATFKNVEVINDL